MSYYAHETACIDDGAQIGSGTKVWHFCHISEKAIIGERCVLGQNVFVANNVRIGNNVKIQNNVAVYEGVTLEDDVFCGPSMVFTNVKTPRAAVVRNTAEHFGKTLVRQGASIGANATVICGATLGRFSFVAAGAVITKDVPDHALMAGVPARQIGWACTCGNVLDKQNDKEFLCPECASRFQLEKKGALEKISGGT